MRKLLLLTLLALPLAAGPIIGGACADGTLAEYIALGSTGCTTSAGVLLSDFAYTPTNTLLAEAVAVSLFEDSALRTAVIVSGDWTAEQNETIAFDLAWKWAAGPGFIEGTYLKSGTLTAPWSLALTTLGYTDTFDSNGSYTSGFSIGAGNTTGIAHAAATATAGTGGVASVASYFVYYEVPVPSSVPEPSTWAMMGLGLAAIVRSSRSKSRRSL